ncbi:hypothetical protein [Spongiactinospora gelatinilytica]|uniref:hypothetical protein n=1 Tax=Spongiactinospora gelatinilytica TaxID=2666298 RepID=UPI0011B93906|nr:hypothetical protein [Spongiactinospora gelatinilytica]
MLHVTVLAKRGDMDGAVELAPPIRQAATGVKFQRLDQRLNEFAERLAPHSSPPVVVDYLEANRDRQLQPEQ